MEKLKLSIGYQHSENNAFSGIVQKNKSAIAELYFPWLGVPDGRGLSVRSSRAQSDLENELAFAKSLGIKLNLLFNANCYGEHAVSDFLADKFRKTVNEIGEKFGLNIVTTTSLFIAKLCKANFPNIDVRASVNMDIGTPEAIAYLTDYFDSFYIARSINRHPEKIAKLRLSGKKLFLLANSGCLLNCPAHAFHDNLVAHEGCVDPAHKVWDFFGICWEFYAKDGNQNQFLARSTWVRPEDIDDYENLVDGVKLATRTSHGFERIVQAYAERSFRGNVLSLCEPDFSAIAMLDNNKFPTNWLETTNNPNTPEYEKLFRLVSESGRRNSS